MLSTVQPGIALASRLASTESKVLEVKDLDELVQFLWKETDKPTCLKIGASSSGISRTADKSLIVAANEFGDKVNFLKVDAESPEGKKIVEEFDAHFLPEILCFKPGSFRPVFREGDKAPSGSELIATINHRLFDTGKGQVKRSLREKQARDLARSGNFSRIRIRDESRRPDVINQY